MGIIINRKQIKRSKRGIGKIIEVIGAAECHKIREGQRILLERISNKNSPSDELFFNKSKKMHKYKE